MKYWLILNDGISALHSADELDLFIETIYNSDSNWSDINPSWSKIKTMLLMMPIGHIYTINNKEIVKVQRL